MPATFREAIQPQKVAQPYIDKYHQHLKDIELIFLFTDTPIMVQGKERGAKVVKVSGLNAYLATRHDQPVCEFIVVLVNEEVWKLYDDAKREAEMDKQLMSISVDQESGKIGKRPHDVEEFTEILERHGAWEKDLEEFIAAARNPVLPGMEEAVKPGKGKKKGAESVKIIPRERTTRSKKPGSEAGL